MFTNKKLKRTEYDLNKIVKRDNFTFINQTVAEKGQVVFLGDSITEMLSTGDWFGEYTKKSGLAVYNRGISGDTSNRLYERLVDNVTCIEPSCVVLLIGTNDLGLGLDSEFAKENIEKTLSLLKHDCPNTKIILQAVYPVNPTVHKSCAGRRKNSDILELNKKLLILAQEHKITYLDLTEKLSDKKGNLKKEYTFDGLHLNAKGYEVTTKETMKLLP